MSRIYWDSMLFIYWLEDHPRFAPRVNHILDRISQRGDVLCTSSFTIGEVLAGAYKRGDEVMAAAIRKTFLDGAIELLPFTAQTGDTYARIRARSPFSPPDAIHLASAAEARTDVFLTNDESLVGKAVPGIQFVARMDTDLF